MYTLILDSTTKSLTIELAATATSNTITWTAAYADNTGSVFTEGGNNGVINNTTPVTLVAAPSASTRRIIKSLAIQNNDSTSQTATIKYVNSSGATSIVAKVALSAGDVWTTDGTYDSTGKLKTSGSGGSAGDVVGPISSVANEIALFDGTTGKLIKAATTTGIVKATSGQIGAAVAGTDYVAPGGALGTPSSGTLTNATGLPISTGVAGLGTGVATFLATPTSANLAAALTDETGTGANVFANSPTLVTPILGTPTSGTLTNCTGLPVSTGVAGLGTNVAAFLATPSSANLAAALTDETGTGANVFANSPTLVTPTLGVATATTINKVAFTAPATGATVTLADGSTLATSGANSITLTSTGATNVTLPTSGRLATAGFAVTASMIWG